MAVTLTAEDLKTPKGRLFAALLPLTGATLDAQIGTWLTLATTQVAALDASLQNEAARLWIYGQAYAQAADELSSQPLDAEEGGQSRSYRMEQVSRLDALARQYQTEFAQVKASATVTVTTSPSVSVKNKVTW